MTYEDSEESSEEEDTSKSISSNQNSSADIIPDSPDTVNQKLEDLNVKILEKANKIQQQSSKMNNLREQRKSILLITSKFMSQDLQ